jgi:hypothetical protein
MLDLQVVMNIGHIGTVLKGLPVTGFCFVELALHTQDVSQVPVRCAAKQNKHDISRYVLRHMTGCRLSGHQHNRREKLHMWTVCSLFKIMEIWGAILYYSLSKFTVGQLLLGTSISLGPTLYST